MKEALNYVNVLLSLNFDLQKELELRKQDEQALVLRIESLEREVLLLQRQIHHRNLSRQYSTT